MVKPATILVTIDESLRYVLYGISVLLNVELSAREIERLFSDARAGESPAGPYVFHESPDVVVSGRVEEYELGTVWLSVLANRFPKRRWSGFRSRRSTLRSAW